jgi:inner membrane protein
MRFPLLGKFGSLCLLLLVLLFGLYEVGDVVRERTQRQREAEQSVVDALAGTQFVMGPLLQRHCEETWEHLEGEGKDRRTQPGRREFVLSAWPAQLKLDADARIEPRYRGLFTINSYLATLQLAAEWPTLAALQAQPEQPGGVVRCKAPVVAVALADARGIQQARMATPAGAPLPVLPGSTMQPAGAGFHAVLPEAVLADDAALARPLALTVSLTLRGTRNLSFVPPADQTQVSLRSDWPHPSFGGRFLPVHRQVGTAGFEAQWQVSSLATSARQSWERGGGLCDTEVATSYPMAPAAAAAAARERPCVDSFGVSFFEPVNGYVLNDRALKYGLLFIVLTFVGVLLVEVMKRLRVHPVQYLLVGCALTVFFLLLLSLSEHLAFGTAYLCAAAACSLLIGFYGSHVLGGRRAGAAMAGAIGLLYGALYLVLQMEQAALLLGSMLLFAVLAAVMVATRRVDWYALSAQLREQAKPPTAPATAPAVSA